MIALPLLLLPLLAPQEDPPDGITVSADLEPKVVAVGEPFTLTLDVTHPAGTRPFVHRIDLDLDESWVEFDSARPEIVSGEASREKRTRTRFRWTLASLEPGERALPDLPFASPGRPLIIEVTGVLGPGEDAPRPQRGFRPIPGEEQASSPLAAWIAASALGVFLVALPFLVARARRRPRRPAPAPLERLAALRERVRAPRPAHFELSLLVREAIDDRTGRDRQGLTDAEWLEVLESESRLPAAAKVAAGAVLERCGAVKYGRHEPTVWAMQETFEEARRAIAAAVANESGEGRP